MTTVGAVLAAATRQPVTFFVSRWNWKTALLSMTLRSLIFLLTNLSAGLGPALRAAGVEMLFVSTTNGFYGALTQALAQASPAWAGALCAMVVVPALSHSLEFAFHWAAGTPELGRSIVASIAVSAVSALFSVFAMRRNVLVVGQTSASFWDDLKQLPKIYLLFAWQPFRFVIWAVTTLYQRAVAGQPRS